MLIRLCRLLQALLHESLLVLGELLMLGRDRHTDIHAITLASVAVGTEAVVQVLAALANPVTLPLRFIHLHHASFRCGGAKGLSLSLSIAKIFIVALVLEGWVLQNEQMKGLALLVKASPNLFASVARLASCEVVVLAIVAHPAVIG